MYCWNSINDLPAGSGPKSIPSIPASPITPPHRVLSKSRTKHFFGVTYKAFKKIASSLARALRKLVFNLMSAR
jgi:hypothetical protein